MSSYTIDKNMVADTRPQKQLGSSNIVILWAFLIKQLFHSRLLDMRSLQPTRCYRASLAIYHLVSNARSWNNCKVLAR